MRQIKAAGIAIAMAGLMLISPLAMGGEQGGHVDGQYPPPRDTAKVLKVYEDSLYGKTELRTDDYHRHVIDGQWTPWHYRYQPHNWGSQPAPAPVPAPSTAVGRVSANFPSSTMAGQCCGPITVTKQAPEEVAVGEVYTYLLHVTNRSDVPVKDVVVTDTLDENFQVVSSEPAASGRASWTLGKLGPGETKTITVKGKAGGTGTIVNCTTVTYTPYICIKTRVVQPALQLTKTLPDEAMVCDDIPLTLTVRNDGTGVARNVTITDKLPDGLVVKSNDHTQIDIPVGDLGPGQAKRYAVTLKGNRTGNFTNRASASAEGDLSDNAQASLRLIMPVLTIAKSGPQRQFLGRPVTYTVKVTNTGNAPAKQTVVEDLLPSNASFVKASPAGQVNGNRITWNVGTLAPNASETFSITVMPNELGRIANSASANAYCAEAVTDQVATNIEGIPAILLEVVDNPDPVEVGTNTTYTIVVTNQGSAVGTNIQIVAELEQQQQYVSAAGATRPSVDGKKITFAPLPSLAPKAKATWTMLVKAADAGDVRFRVNMTSDQIGRPVTETEASNFYK